MVGPLLFNDLGKYQSWILIHLTKQSLGFGSTACTRLIDDTERKIRQKLENLLFVVFTEDFDVTTI